jgi:endonuclease G
MLMKKPTNKTVEDAIAALDTVRREWLRRPGVTAVDVGFKQINDVPTDIVALRVHVERKLPVAELAASEVFNDTAKADKKIDGFPVDVIEAKYAPASALTGDPTVLDYEDVAGLETIDRRTTFNPMVGGISVGNPRVTAGTLGAIVYNRSNCRQMILSNWHVLAGSGSAAVGENILQPGRIDGGTSTVATLTAMRLNSQMDAAVATLNGTRPAEREILGLGTIPGIDTPTLGMLVVKSGRSTAITRGVIDGVSMSVSINYGDPGVQAFSNQIRIVPRPPWPGTDYEVSIGGDSGSVWLNEANNRAIGLHFAGETNTAPASENAICSPMGPIATELNFSFLPVLCWKGPVVLDPCVRWPFLCRPIVRYPIPRIPYDPPFAPPIGPSYGPIVGTRIGQAAGSGCGCDGHPQQLADDESAQRADLLAYLMEQG